MLGALDEPRFVYVFFKSLSPRNRSFPKGKHFFSDFDIIISQ